MLGVSHGRIGGGKGFRGVRARAFPRLGKVPVSHRCRDPELSPAGCTCPGFFPPHPVLAVLFFRTDCVASGTKGIACTSPSCAWSPVAGGLAVGAASGAGLRTRTGAVNSARPFAPTPASCRGAISGPWGRWSPLRAPGSRTIPNGGAAGSAPDLRGLQAAGGVRFAGLACTYTHARARAPGEGS